MVVYRLFIILRTMYGSDKMKKLKMKDLGYDIKKFHKYFERMGCEDATEHQKRVLISGLIYAAIAGNQVDNMLEQYYDKEA